MRPQPLATAELLQRLAQSSALDLRVEPDALGVGIELVDSGLRFHHSFVAGAIARRARQSGQLLLRACNNRQRSIRSVLDLTAGWGVDAYLLARHGQTVTMLEQSELVKTIVDWSLQRLAQDPDEGETARRLTIGHAHALGYLEQQNDREFDCIYLDPMFAAHKSGAKPAKEMQILQALTGNADIEACFELALERARKRVVVKRAAKAPALNGHSPDLTHRAKTIRFDVYLTA
jgi:16S rRNA (guanine1516-N2)-methyltransferase